MDRWRSVYSDDGRSQAHHRRNSPPRAGDRSGGDGRGSAHFGRQSRPRAPAAAVRGNTWRLLWSGGVAAGGGGNLWGDVPGRDAADQGDRHPYGSGGRAWKRTLDDAPRVVGDDGNRRHDRATGGAGIDKIYGVAAIRR